MYTITVTNLYMDTYPIPLLLVMRGEILVTSYVINIYSWDNKGCNWRGLYSHPLIIVLAFWLWLHWKFLNVSNYQKNHMLCWQLKHTKNIVFQMRYDKFSSCSVNYWQTHINIFPLFSTPVTFYNLYLFLKMSYQQDFYIWYYSNLHNKINIVL